MLSVDQHVRQASPTKLVADGFDPNRITHVKGDALISASGNVSAHKPTIRLKHHPASDTHSQMQLISRACVTFQNEQRQTQANEVPRDVLPCVSTQQQRSLVNSSRHVSGKKGGSVPPYQNESLECFQNRHLVGVNDRNRRHLYGETQI